MTPGASEEILRTATVARLAELVGGAVDGDGALEIRGLASLEEAGEGQISFLADLKQASRLEKTRAAALIVPAGLPPFPKPLIRTANPYVAYAKVQTFFSARPFRALGIDPRAYVAPGAEVAAEVSIYPFAYVGPRSRIGSGVVLFPGVYVGEGAEIGEGTTLYPNVAVLDRCRVGKRVIIHSGTVIGSDGFGFAPDQSGYVKIPQVGIVEIEDDVEIGANCAVDRAAMGKTRIGRGVKTDNLVQIGHNVTIGENTVLVAQVGIAGSTEIGRWVAMGGQVGVVGHIKIGDQARIGAQAGVAHDVKPGETISGSPAFAHREWLRAQAVFPRLPEIRRNLGALERRLDELEKKLGKPEKPEDKR